ncbi:beta-lactamase family protein [Streptomyces flavotricini]|uniref:Beta-lactamase family protein n=1 Tax=Streptomyces flavotricini TaxID=66888 RepID=A0ABS8DZE3_9ACTN|nr:beta-lactamase family protein [Streptomyces flavotricini]MCC0094216.1 beta-lactamase family protein [Streptomyces flavotricini]
MTLQSDLADAADAAGLEVRIRGVLRDADPDAVWAAGGPDGPHAGSADETTVLDVGGLMPVLALWPVIGSLVAEEALRLHTPLAAYGVEADAGTTTHHLLSHSTGPAAHAALTRLAEHLTGSPLAELAATRVWHPLGMTGTGFADGALHAPPADLARFLSHLLSPAEHPLPRAWVAESLRIRTGELTPARGLLWHPAPHGTWSYGETPTVWISPRLHRWALLHPARSQGSLRTTFREAAFAPVP